MADLPSVNDGGARADEVRQAIEQRVRLAWPNLPLDVGQFIVRVASLSDGKLDRVTVSDSLAIEDLALAFSCSKRDPIALQLFSHEYDDDLKVVASKFHISDADFSDVRQSIWDRLFVGIDGTGKILEYKGVGRLRHWFRAVATRMIVDRVRQVRPSERPSNEAGVRALQLAAADTDLELSAMKRRYGNEFREAFEHAVALLEPEERNAIHCYYVLGMTIDQMAAAFGTHRATAARRVTRAREKLRDGTCARLKTKLGACTGEIDSIMRMYDGEISITLSRLLT